MTAPRYDDLELRVDPDEDDDPPRSGMVIVYVLGAIVGFVILLWWVLR